MLFVDKVVVFHVCLLRFAVIIQRHGSQGGGGGGGGEGGGIKWL